MDNKNTMQRIETKISAAGKQMLVEISEEDNRSITKEVEYLIKRRHKELFGSPNKKGGK